jgi:hypothetical protein
MAILVRLRIFALIAPVVCSCAMADVGHEAPVGAATQIDDEPLRLAGLFDLLDRQQANLSVGLEDAARAVDAFFGDDRAYEDANETRGQITLEASQAEGESPRFDLRVRAKVQLPRMQKKLRLLVESDAEDLGQDQTQTQASTPAGAVEDTNFNLALETRLPVFRDWNLAPAIGVAAGWPLDPYVRLRATRYFDLQPWLARFSAKASWYDVAGQIVTTSLDFDRRLAEAWLFRAATKLKWQMEGDLGENTEASQALTLYQSLSNRRSASYSVSAYADSEQSWAVHSYVVSYAYRQAVYKQWLYAEVNPYVEFLRDYEWDDNLGLILRLEALVGRWKYE